MPVAYGPVGPPRERESSRRDSTRLFPRLTASRWDIVRERFGLASDFGFDALAESPRQIRENSSTTQHAAGAPCRHFGLWRTRRIRSAIHRDQSDRFRP